MDVLLTDQNRHFRDLAREVAETTVRPIAAELDRTRAYPYKVLEELQKKGLMGLWIPKEYGGAGAGYLDLCLVVEELSKACGGVGAAFAVNALGTFPILITGTPEQKQKYLPKMATGEYMAAFGLSEITAGSDAGSLKATAVRDGDQWLITGDKKWTTGASVASVFTVFANTNPAMGPRGITAFIVEKGAPGFEVGKREELMGIRCLPVHEMHFRNTPVPASNMLGVEGKGFPLALSTLDRARPGVAAQAVGVAQGALELAVKYANSREQFGKPIAVNQALQFMLAEMATKVDAARLLVHHVARLLDAGIERVSKEAAEAKLFASDTAMSVTTDAVQIFGGYGYCQDYPIEKYMRDAKITQIYEGTNQVQRMVIGTAVLKQFA